MKNLFRISGLILIIILMFSAGCEKSDQGRLPEIFTNVGFGVTPTSAICSGRIITSNLDSTISEWGVCWSTGHLPVITDNKVSSVTEMPWVWLTITGLSQQTGYYVRAYATNNTGTAYGEELSFTTPADHTGETGTVGDADGNVYQTIGIGGQIWMTENLKTTRYSNGDLIETTTPATLDIYAEVAPKYQWAYDGDESNVATYGRFYTWDAVTDTRNVCPAAWHVPSNIEWKTLELFLGDENVAGGKLKETGTTYWTTPNTGATNETGFSALPGGFRRGDGIFDYIGDWGAWWSSTPFFNYVGKVFLYYDSSSDRLEIEPASFNNGFSVRCLRDDD